MTDHAEVLTAWAQLPPEVREVAAPIVTGAVPAGPRTL